MNEWMGKIKKPKKGQNVNIDQVIQEGIELAKGIASEANQLINAAFKNFADRAIFIGLICHQVKGINSWRQETLGCLGGRKFFVHSKEES